MAGITSAPQQQQHLPGSAVSGTSATSGDDDAVKRNTDCVYFLASPLTCKKGSECEYRHSDIARVNPRDCWYWMNGNCLNLKCGFRHPPLEGLFGAQVSTPVGASVPHHQAASTPSAPASFGSALGKQAVPCVFFQNGCCMKGDWCPFSHGPNSVTNKVLPSQAPATTAEPPTLKKSFGGPEKFTQQKMPPQLNISKPVELPSQVKVMPRVGSAPTKDETSKERKHLASVVQPSRQRTSVVPPFHNETQASWSGRVQQPVSLMDNINMNGKDAEEISREPSPGFDVLVDNELGDSVYYPSEDQFGRPADFDGGSEYFDGHSGDHKSIVDTERDIYHDSRGGYDSYERHQGQHAWEQHKPSSERVLSGLSVNRERGRYSGSSRSPDPVHESDLRYHLSKHSRTGGLRSAITRDHPCERTDHRSYHNPRRDLHQDHERRENPLSSRLQGRIKMPGHSSSDNGNELQQGRKTERLRPQPELSQGSFLLPSRLHNRIKDDVDFEDQNDHRTKRGLPIRRETRNDDNGNFAGPKTLSELKRWKTVETNDKHVNYQPSDAKRKYSKVEYPQNGGAGGISFDGPKPLEEILKRKRVSSTSEDDNQADKAQQTENETSKSTSGLKIEKDSALLTDGQSLLSSDHAEAEEEMVVVEDGDQEVENYAAEDDEYYEQADGEAYELDEGDNGDLDGDYIDDDDDDFAKKMGVMY